MNKKMLDISCKTYDIESDSIAIEGGEAGQGKINAS
jgi:hypothetical protein